MKIHRLLSSVFALALVLLLITAAIALPIYCRGFYYAHIEAMDLPAYTGLTAGELRTAYNEVLDYLTLPGREFGTGAFPHSAEGAAHFADCKVLFDLNRNVLVFSAGVLGILLLLGRKYGPYRLGKHSAAFWAAVVAVVLPLTVGGLAALDFDRAFVIFHTLFFPGKTNWIFDWRTDPIILALPQDFFMHCAMLIGGGLLLFSAMVLVLALRAEKKARIRES
jgi:integral membrane protein (TIGR01906 family)